MKIAKHIIDEIMLFVKELSDKHFQYRVWVLYNVDNYSSSFIELLNRLKNDLATDYVLEQSPADTGLSKELISEMKKMMELLKNYDYKGKTDEQIINDSEWNKVVEQAQVAMKIYSEEKIT